MQGNINSLPGPCCVVRIEIQERIERRGRVCVQKRRAQSRLTDFADGEVLSLIPGVTETQFPIPRLEVIGNFSHLSPQANIEQLIPVGEFFAPRTGIVDASEPNTRGYRETRAIRKEVWNSCICNRKRIKRIRERHTDAIRTKE